MEGGGRTERGSCSRDAEGSQQPLGTSLPWALGMGSQHESTCRRAVQASLVTCSSVGEGKVSLPGSSLSPNPSCWVSGRDGTCWSSPHHHQSPGAFRLPESRAGQACLKDPGLPLRLLLGLFPGCRAPSSPTHCADPPKAPGAIHSPSLDSPVWGVGGGGASTKRKTSAVSVTPNEGGGAWIRTAAISRRMWDHGKISPLLARWMWRELKDLGQPGATPGGTAPREKSTRQRPARDAFVLS